MEAAVDQYAKGFKWTVYETSTGYLNKMIRFVGDENGERIKDDNDVDIQGSKGPLILVHDANRDCLSWLTKTAEAWGDDSWPRGLFS